MADDFIQFAFSGGELSENFLGRPDLEKFDLGLRKARNWFVDYRGGASTRPGLEFVDICSNPLRKTRLVPFSFNKEQGNTYLMVFGHEYVRFIQNGGYVFESGQTVSSVTITSPGVFTVPGHGFSNGDLVQLRSMDGMESLNLRTFFVRNKTTNTFTLEKANGDALSTTGLGPYVANGGSVQRVYTVATTYQEEELFDLVFDQFRDDVTITALGHPPRRLSRLGPTSWNLVDINFDQNITAVTGLTGTPSAVASAGVVYAVTRVNLSGIESVVEERLVLRTSVNITATAGSILLSWGDYDNTSKYRIYRSIFYSDGTKITKGEALGYIGETRASSFLDDNIAPQFDITPPDRYNPFADRAVRHINITARGSGYDDTTTVSVSGGSGSGFKGEPVVVDGEIVGVIIADGGSGYGPTPSVSFSGTGTGATADAVVSEADGNNPRAVRRFEQRTIYAGTENFPVNLFGSVPGKRNSFSFSPTGADDDSFDLELDAPELTPIKYMETSPIGLLVFTEGALYQVYGTGQANAALTGTNAKSLPRTSNGIGDVPPVVIDDNILYVQSESTGLRGLQPSENQGFYSLADLSIFSNHLFVSDNQVVDLAYAQNPFRILWLVREDGTLVSFTYVPEHNVYALTPHDTLGWFESVAVIREDAHDRVYFVVRRKLADGSYVRYIERFDLRDINNSEDMWAVDAGLTIAPTMPDVDVTLDGTTLTASASVFNPTDVGKHFRAGGGRGTITSYTSDTEVEVEIDIPILDDPDRMLGVYEYTSGSWCLDPLYSTVSGLDHLEGLEVEVLVDGNIQTNKTVVDGAVNLDAPGSKIIIGLPWTGELISLPVAASDMIVENKVKRVVDISARLAKTRGLEFADFNTSTYYPLKERTDEGPNEPTRLQSGVKSISINSGWERDGSIRVKKAGPVSATLLGFVRSVELGGASDNAVQG